MIKTTKQGVFAKVLQNGSTNFYIKYSIHDKQYKVKLGSNLEGWTVHRANEERMKRIHTNIVPVSKRDRITLDRGADNYLESIRHKSDYKNTLGRYNNHIKQYLGHRLMYLIKPIDIQKLKSDLTIKVSFKTGKVLAPKTVDDMINLVHSIYNYYNRFSDIPIISPASVGKIERYNPDNARQRYLSTEEVNKLYWHIENRNSFTLNRNVKERVTQDLLIFTRLALSTGARLRSVLTIRKKDIDFNTGTVDIVNHKSKRRYKGYINKKLLHDLVEWCNSISDEYYVIGRHLKELHISTINRRMKVIMDRVFNEHILDSKERVVVHTLRHTFGSLLAIQGTPIQQISKLLDHTTLQQSLVYAKLSLNSGFNQVELLGL